MSLPDRYMMEGFFFKTALITALGVFLLSIFHGYSALWIVLRTLGAFMLVYFLGKGLLDLWIKLTPPPPKKEKNKEFRSTIDVLLGNLDDQGIEVSLDGIRNQSKTINLNEEKQNESENGGEIQENARVIPGQINVDMKNGMQDSASKAELGRRMGLEEK